IGLHAQRHRDTPVRWHFVAEGRVGEDFSILTDDDRPMTKKQLAAEIGEQNIYGSPTEYRAAIDGRLFGLGAERYEQLLTLILTLRRPQLAKNLDPVKLSDTLTDGLRPVDDDLIAEAARSFDDMEAVARTLEGLAAADEATQAFLASYTTYLRTHARAAADALTKRAEAAQVQRASVAADQEACRGAEEEQRRAEARRESAETGVAGLRGRIEQLKASGAYAAVEQMGDLERLVRTCLQAANDAKTDLDTRQAATARARSDAERAAASLNELGTEVAHTAAALADHAARAGIPWQPVDAGPEGLDQRAGAKITVRLADVRAVREAETGHRKATHARDLARIALDRAIEARDEADQAEQSAAAAVDQAHLAAEQALVTWSARHAALLDEAEWRDLAAALADALARFGEPDAPSLEGTYNGKIQAAEQQVRDDQAAVRAHRKTLDAERLAVTAERDAISAENDDAPPPYPGRPVDRTGRDGAPLWRLVRFADGVDDGRAAAIEAALEATGMLDAWLSPSNTAGQKGGAGSEDEPGGLADDGYLVPGTPVPGHSLADVLVPEGGTDVPNDRITAALRSVTLGGELFAGTAVIGADGWYSHGITAGRHRKEHAEYIGATARARRRALRIAECDARIQVLTDQIAEAGRRVQALADRLGAFADARQGLPPTRDIAAAQREHARAAGHLRSARSSAEQAQTAFDESAAAVTVTERALRRTAAEHSLPAEDADTVEAATRRFESAARDLAARHREHARQAEAAGDARNRLDHAAQEEESAARAHRAAHRRHAGEDAKLQALRDSVGAEARQVLDQIAAAESGLDAAVAEE
ncbi:MAG: hypothetical protein ACRDN0_05820, partial [Trebonia sp.]